MSNINDEMKTAANHTIKAAKEKFGQELDFSEQSIIKLDYLLEQAYQSLSSRVKDEKTSNSISRTANAWGSYLGEYMCLKWGGKWVQRGSERMLHIKNFEFSPIGFVYQKITSHPEYSAKNYLAEIERKVLPPPIVPPQSNVNPAEISSSQPLNNSNSLNNAKGNSNEAILTILGFVGFFVLSYFIGFSGSTDGTSNICSGMICLGTIVGLFALYQGSQHRSKVVNTAIQEQKQTSSNSGESLSSNQSSIVSCRICQHTVSRTAPSCPNCGELYPGLISKCPNCNSKNIRITPKGFSVGKAAAGAVIAGPVGVAGGLHGRKDLELKCSNCQLNMTIKHDEIN